MKAARGAWRVEGVTVGLLRATRHALVPLLVPVMSLRAQDDSLVVREHDAAVRVRDGVMLRAEVLRPRGSGPFPVLVYRTPYGKDRAVESYSIFRRAVERGYAVVAQDVRGRYASEGEFLPYQQEGRDGYDTIEWAAAQPWSNGAVGTFGLSYPGAVQWLAAIERPPHLRAMAPAMTFASPRQFFYSGGVWDASWSAWTWLNIAPDLRRRSGVAGPTTYALAESTWMSDSERIRRHLPLLDLPDLKGVAPWYYEWMRHPATDKWWDWAELRDKYARVDAAVLNISGWHDEAYGPHGAATNFAGLAAARGSGAPRAKLVIGPWPHGLAGMTQTTVGEREVGSEARIDYDELVLRWMDRWVRGIDNGVDREKPVRVFVMGDNRWREADAWPVPGTRAETLYFASATAGANGMLTARRPTVERGSSTFRSNPADPVSDPFASASGAHDYRALAQRSDLLTFETPSLESDLEVVGPLVAQLHLSVDAPDTDIWVKVLDVAPDGTAYNLMSPGLDVLRASWRDTTAGRSLLEPGRIYALRLSDLVTANTFKRGHRIRVHVAAAFYPHFSLNLHTGELETTHAAMRSARITIHHDRQHPSLLVLSVVPRGARQPADGRR
jgi:putative CocE/NonD family hydrolase